MKKIVCLLLTAVFTTALVSTSTAQRVIPGLSGDQPVDYSSPSPRGDHSKKYRVTDQLKETFGSYGDRKLYRTFLIQSIKNCPFVSQFQISEIPGNADNHEVVWTYEVNGWNDITRFYDWIQSHMRDSGDSTLQKALTPYQPYYSLGGLIRVENKNQRGMAKN